MLSRVSIAAAIFSGVAFSQVTTPVGLNTTEGNAVFFHFQGTGRLFQSIDTTQAATPAVYTRFSLRRDGASATSVNYAARTVDFALTLGPANTAIVSGDLTENMAGSTQVFPLTSVNMPDWTNPPGAPPAPFDFNITFAPYTHGGGPLMWMMQYANSSTTAQTVFDREYNAYGSTAGVLIAGSVGCVATGRTVAFAHTTAIRNGGPATGAFGMHLQVTPTNAPSSAPVLLSIDSVDSALTLPFLCRPLHAMPTVLLPLGTSSATGTLPVKHIVFGHNPSIIGASLVTQLVSFDIGQPAPFLPLALSNGRTTTMGANPTLPCSAACYAFATSPATTGTMQFGGCGVAEFQ